MYRVIAYLKPRWWAPHAAQSAAPGHPRALPQQVCHQRNARWTLSLNPATHAATGASSATRLVCPAASVKRPAWNVSTNGPFDGSKGSLSAGRCRVDRMKMRVLLLRLDMRLYCRSRGARWYGHLGVLADRMVRLWDLSAYLVRFLQTVPLIKNSITLQVFWVLHRVYHSTCKIHPCWIWIKHPNTTLIIVNTPSLPYALRLTDELNR
jgi:hypothetical protein